MKEAENFPAHDPAKEENARSACLSTPILELVLIGRPPQRVVQALDEASEIIVFEKQIRNLKEKYSHAPSVVRRLKERLSGDVSFHVVKADPLLCLDRYNEWKVIQLSESKPLQIQWHLAGLFTRVSITSRIFLANVSLVEPKMLFTHDQDEGDFAALLGCQSRLLWL